MTDAPIVTNDKVRNTQYVYLPVYANSPTRATGQPRSLHTGQVGGQEGRQKTKGTAKRVGKIKGQQETKDASQIRGVDR